MNYQDLLKSYQNMAFTLGISVEDAIDAIDAFNKACQANFNNPLIQSLTPQELGIDKPSQLRESLKTLTPSTNEYNLIKVHSDIVGSWELNDKPVKLTLEEEVKTGTIAPPKRRRGIQIQLRHDTFDNWMRNNPILAEGEVGIAFDTLTEDTYIFVGNGKKTISEMFHSSRYLSF